MSREFPLTTVYLSDDEVSSITALASLPLPDLLHEYEAAGWWHRILTDPIGFSCSRNAGVKEAKLTINHRQRCNYCTDSHLTELTLLHCALNKAPLVHSNLAIDTDCNIKRSTTVHDSADDMMTAVMHYTSDTLECRGFLSARIQVLSVHLHAHAQVIQKWETPVAYR